MTGWDYVVAFLTCTFFVVAAVQISYNIGFAQGRQFECAERDYLCKCCRKED